MLKKLVELKFNAASTGIYCLADAIEIKKQNKFIKMVELYKIIGEKYKIKWTCIERKIRHCIETSNNEYNQMKNVEVITILSILFD